MNEELRKYHEAANLFPLLKGDEFEELKRDIKQNGLLETIVLHPDGSIIDGRNRHRACIETNTLMRFETWNGKGSPISFVVSKNLHRRHLSSSQRAVLATDAVELMEKLEQEAKERQSTSTGGNEPQLVVILPQAGTGKTRDKAADIFGTSPRYISDAKKLKREAPDLLDDIRNGKQSIGKAKKELRKRKRKQEHEVMAEKAKTLEVSVDFRNGDFVKQLANIPDGSVDLILTDPPYPREFLPEWSKLSKFASRVLKPGGFCIAYSGQLNLPKVMRRMGEHLEYYWTFNLIHTGNKQLIFPRNVFCGWKPLLIYQNGFSKLKEPIEDIIRGTGLEKKYHNWQQAEKELIPIIEAFSNPGDLVVEPFAGSGTTIIAATKLKREIIACEIEVSTYNLAKKRLSENDI